MPPEEMAHDEELVDAIMDGGPSYALEMVENLRARIAELEAMWVEERAARLWADDIFRYEGHLTWSEVDARTRSHCIEEARAALAADGKKAAPKDCPDCGDRPCDEITCPHHREGMESDGAGRR